MEWERKTTLPKTTSSLVFVEFTDLTAEFLAKHAPDVIVSPALAWKFDCIDLAMKLESFGYRGPYRAISTELPKPELIKSEIKQLCPNVDFGFLSL